MLQTKYEKLPENMDKLPGDLVQFIESYNDSIKKTIFSSIGIIYASIYGRIDSILGDDDNSTKEISRIFNKIFKDSMNYIILNNPTHNYLFKGEGGKYLDKLIDKLIKEYNAANEKIIDDPFKEKEKLNNLLGKYKNKKNSLE